MFPHLCLYAGDFNCGHADWGYDNNSGAVSAWLTGQNTKDAKERHALNNFYSVCLFICAESLSFYVHVWFCRPTRIFTTLRLLGPEDVDFAFFNKLVETKQINF